MERRKYLPDPVSGEEVVYPEIEEQIPWGVWMERTIHAVRGYRLKVSEWIPPNYGGRVELACDCKDQRHEGCNQEYAWWPKDEDDLYYLATARQGSYYLLVRSNGLYAVLWKFIDHDGRHTLVPFDAYAWPKWLLNPQAVRSRRTVGS